MYSEAVFIRAGLRYPIENVAIEFQVALLCFVGGFPEMKREKNRSLFWVAEQCTIYIFVLKVLRQMLVGEHVLGGRK